MPEWMIPGYTGRRVLGSGGFGDVVLAREACWRLTSRWREENYFRYARTHFALHAPVEAAWTELQAAADAAAAVPARIRLGEIAPDMARLEAEVKQITHAIRMAACNAETALARALDGHYARAGDEACALIREALVTSGDIIPGHGELLIRLDPLTAPRRTQALAALCDQLNQAASHYPGTNLVLRYQVKPTLALHELTLYVRSPAGTACWSSPRFAPSACWSRSCGWEQPE